LVGAIERNPIARVSAGAGVLVLVGSVAVVAFNSLEPSSLSTLWPAKVPPVVGLCTVQLNDDQNGNVSPLFCPGGEVKALAWSYYAQEQLQVTAAGPHPDPAKVETAVQQDLEARASATIWSVRDRPARIRLEFGARKPG
jgi:hypothetical protein